MYHEHVCVLQTRAPPAPDDERELDGLRGCFGHDVRDSRNKLTVGVRLLRQCVLRESQEHKSAAHILEETQPWIFSHDGGIACVIYARIGSLLL